MGAKSKTVFFCSECGNETPKWQGNCPSCGAWNTITEQKKPAQNRSNAARVLPARRASSVMHLSGTDPIRFTTGMGELDRVLGGGAVRGSLVLVGGAPGIGKSTLLLQICQQLCAANRVLYVSGEESEHQIKMRANRLHVEQEELLVMAETEMSNILEEVASVKPGILIVDSIQTVFDGNLDAAPGSVSQVKACTMSLMQLAKGEDITVFVIGHVNKDGAIAGPKVLEHMVDCVLYFEGDSHTSYRILRAAKNRFGATNEIGVFEMGTDGLEQVENPSEALLSGRPLGASGTCVTCVMEGARPVLAEIQALVSPTAFPSPRRTFNGFDFSRGIMLMAILEKRGGLKVSALDAYLNIIGGLNVDEPGADLAAILALASCYTDIPIDADVAAVGEVGLAGELRSVSNLVQRLSEIHRLGFKTCVIPNQKNGRVPQLEGLTVLQAANIGEAIRLVLRKR